MNRRPVSDDHIFPQSARYWDGQTETWKEHCSEAMGFVKEYAKAAAQTKVRNSSTKINHRINQPVMLTLDTSIMNELKEILVQNTNAYNLQGKCLYERSIKLLDVLRLGQRRQEFEQRFQPTINLIYARGEPNGSTETPAIQRRKEIRQHDQRVLLSTLRKDYLSAASNRVEQRNRPRVMTCSDEHQPNPQSTYTPKRMSIPIQTQTVEQLDTLSQDNIDTTEIFTQTELIPLRNFNKIGEIQYSLTVRSSSAHEREAIVQAQLSEELVIHESPRPPHSSMVHKQNNFHVSNRDAATDALIEPAPRRKHLNFASGTLINIHEVLRARRESRSHDSEKMKKIDEFKKHIEEEVEQINRQLRTVRNGQMRKPIGDDDEDEEMRKLQEEIRKLDSQERVPTLKFDLSTKIRQSNNPTHIARSRINTTSKSPARVSSFVVGRESPTPNKVDLKLVKGASKRHYWGRNDQQNQSYQKLSNRLVAQDTNNRESLQRAKQSIELTGSSRRPLLSTRVTQISKRY